MKRALLCAGRLLLGALTFSIIGIGAHSTFAQPYRYMDDAGNIYFVDKVAKVPKQYIDQVVVPTPVPVYSREQVEAIKRKNREEEQKREQKKREEDRERAERARKLAEQQRLDERQIRQMDDSRQLERVTR